MWFNQKVENFEYGLMKNVKPIQREENRFLEEKMCQNVMMSIFYKKFIGIIQCVKTRGTLDLY